MKRIITLTISLAIIFSSIGAVSLNYESSIVVNASLKEVSENKNTTIAYQMLNSENCIYLENSDRILVLKADDDAIGDNTQNVALRIVYFDNDTNFIKVQYNVKRAYGNITKVRYIHKSNSKEMREAIILINSGVYTSTEEGFLGGDILISSFGVNGELCREYIKEIELINLDNIGTNEKNGTKTHILYKSSAYILQKLSLLPNADLGKRATNEDINAFFKKITGIDGTFSGDTMAELIANWNSKTGASPLRGVTYTPGFFEHSGYELQNFGVSTVTYQNTQKIFYDDLAGMLYNLLFINNSNGIPYMVALAQDDAEFKEKLLSLNDFLISNTYYDVAGIEISEKTQIDEITGVKRTVFYMKSGNVNSTYVNEYASADSENFLLCAAYDKRLNLGVPIIYNTKTKKTTELSGRNMAPFGMVMAKDNTAYFVEGCNIYKYEIGKSTQKELLFTEPDGCALQEIPTVTNDGKYISAFCAKGGISEGAPNTIYRINTATGEYSVLVDKQWTDANIDQSVNPFIGHVIINPENPNIVNFMHGGGENVEDRLWLYDNAKIYQPYIQKKKTNGYLGEMITHAFFSLDGKRLYFLRPPASSSCVENGITYVPVGEQNAQETVLNGDYSYIHTSVDAGDKHFVSDTQIVFDEGMFRNEIVLYSAEAEETMLLAYVPIWKKHPCQSHPTFTGDGKGVLFNIADEISYNSAVAYLNVENILKFLDKGEYNRHNEIAFTNCIATLGMKPVFADSKNIVSFQGKSCFETAATAQLPVEIYGTFVKKSDKKINIYITYYDDSNDDVKILYNTDSSSEYDATKNKKAISFSRTAVNKWITKKIELTDASLRSANADASDIIIIPQSSAIHISQIAVFSGDDIGATFSAYGTQGTMAYIPIINPLPSERNLLVLTRSKEAITMNKTALKGEEFIILPVSSEFDKLFVWDDRLRPIGKR